MCQLPLISETNRPARRNKIGADPNNTAWAKSKDNYGHRLLAKSGWQPGQFLGAENANHSDHYTAANASHIRVVLREDNAGLGMQRGKSNAETFGLSTLSGLFGRLNGKSEAEVQKQSDLQRDLELQTYQSRKWGTLNFVYGGLLVGDKMEEKKKLEQLQAEANGNKRKAEDEAPAVEAASSKKRKHTSEAESASSSNSDESEAEPVPVPVKEKKQKKKSKKEAAAENTEEASERVSKKERKEKRKKDGKSGDSDEKALAKQEKRARKEECRKRKEEKRLRKEAKGKTSSQPSRDQSSDSSSDEDEKSSTAPTPNPQPAAMSFGGTRHAVRQRYIQQKRQAGMNPQAMAEILMLKATA